VVVVLPDPFQERGCGGISCWPNSRASPKVWTRDKTKGSSA